MPITILSWFITKNFLRSLAATVPLAATISLYIVAFQYAGNGDYFVAIGGAGMSIIGLVVTLQLASRMNRASTYLFLGRLRSRYQLVLAILLSSYVITVFMACFFTFLVVITDKINPLTTSLLWVIPRWLALFTLATTLGLLCSKLSSRFGTHIFVPIIVVSLLYMGNMSASILGQHAYSLQQLALTILNPVRTMLVRKLSAEDLTSFLYDGGITLFYTVGLLSLAVAAFTKKDISWSE